MKKLFAFREAYMKNEDGATAIEYGLIAAGIALAIAAIVFTMGDSLETMFSGMSDELATRAGEVGGEGGGGEGGGEG